MNTSAATVAIPLSIAQSVLRPCLTNEKSWYACNGDNDPTVGTTCVDDQCTNPAHVSRVPCSNPWHLLPPDVKAAIRNG